MKKTLLRGFLVFLPVLVISCVSKDAKSGTSPWKMADFRGSVTVNGEPAQAGMELTVGDIITVPASGEAHVIPGQRDIIRLMESTTVVIPPGYRGLDLEKGGMIAVLGGWYARRMDQDTTFRVSAGFAEVGAKATAFVVFRGARVYACACYGQVSVSSGTAKRSVKSTHHDSMTIAATADGGATISNSAVILHDDRTIERLASRAGISNIRWDDR